MIEAIPLIHDVSFNITPDQFFLDIRSLDTYVMVQQETFYEFCSQPDYRKLYIEARRRIRDMPLDRLLRGAEMRDGPLMLELCLRRIMLCEIDGVHAEEITDMLYDLSGLNPKPDGTAYSAVMKATPRLRLRAIALLTWIIFRLFWQDQVRTSSMRSTLDSPLVRKAVRFAEHCVAEGFRPPVVLRLASWCMMLRARHGADFRHIGASAQYSYLWIVYDDYKDILRSREQERLDKVSRAPHEYCCAADGCGIQAVHRQALRRCAGPCPSDCKPHYCSTECQKRHWFVHRYFCREDPQPIVQDDGDPDWIDVATYEPQHGEDELGDDASAIWAESQGSEIFIDIPNVSNSRPHEVYRVRTKTLSPALLRSYKRLWELSEPARVAKSIELLQWLGERAADMDTAAPSE